LSRESLLYANTIAYITASDVTDWEQRGELSPGKVNVKTRLPLNLYFGFSILLVFSTLLFLCFFYGLFSGGLGF